LFAQPLWHKTEKFDHSIYDSILHLNEIGYLPFTFTTPLKFWSEPTVKGYNDAATLEHHYDMQKPSEYHPSPSVLKEMSMQQVYCLEQILKMLLADAENHSDGKGGLASLFPNATELE
jgi:hypothetical protein